MILLSVRTPESLVILSAPPILLTELSLKPEIYLSVEQEADVLGQHHPAAAQVAKPVANVFANQATPKSTVENCIWGLSFISASGERQTLLVITSRLLRKLPSQLLSVRTPGCLADQAMPKSPDQQIAFEA